MIDHVRRLAIFATMADAGSFSAAAKRPGLSTSVVSQHMAALEEHLGVPLLYQSTLALSITDKGQRLYEAATQMLEATTQGFDSLAGDAQALVGTIRVTMPLFLSSRIEAAT